MTLHRTRATLSLFFSSFSFSCFFVAVCYVLEKNKHKIINLLSVAESLEQGCLVRFCRLTFFPRSFFSNFKSYAYIWSNTRVAGSCIDYSVNSCYLYIHDVSLTSQTRVQAFLEQRQTQSGCFHAFFTKKPSYLLRHVLWQLGPLSLSLCAYPDHHFPYSSFKT